ncbi:MAG: hypothetical protein J2P41_22075, partial [Blastocatellia bacterium]|nr:hypothetical protein [Blastocatellia bacterium]
KTPKIKPLGEEAIPKKAGAARKKSIAKPVKKATTKAAKPVKKAAAKAAKPVKKATAKAAVARPAAKAASKKIAGKVAGKSPVRGKFASKPKSGRKGKRA